MSDIYTSVDMNNQTNGSLQKNPPTADGWTGKRRAKDTRPKRSILAWLVSTILRLLLWYVALTALFRCPPSLIDLNADSPKICRPYLQLRDRLAPHTEPYYIVYLKPYVDQASPYVSKFNEQVYGPTSAFAKQQYGIYGAPRVARLWNYTEDKWVDVFQPQVEAGKEWATARYESTLSPHVSQIIAVTTPYYEQLKAGLEDAYQSTAATIVPAYEYALPVLQKTYGHGHHIVADIILPYLYWAESSTLSFWNRKVWPQLVILYGENVEPQLMRITERLGRYKDGKKLETILQEMDASSSLSSASSTVSSFASSLSSTAATIIQSPDETESAKTETTSMSEVEIREKIESDLDAWQKKFARASDKGADDLKERVTNITNTLIKHQAHSVGKALVSKLKEQADSSISKLKSKINHVVQMLPEDASEDDVETARTAIQSAIRSLGADIRKKAIAVRDWRTSYNNETISLINEALQSTLDVIDSIRDLGLQEIGMRWAWMEGVTYRDWSRYHELKKTFDEWRKNVESVALDHKGLLIAKDEGEQIYDIAMDIAQEVAIELIRLQKVAEWKINARDSTDDFSDHVVPPKAAKPTQDVLEHAEDAVAFSQETTESIINAASGNAEEAFLSLSSLVVGEELTEPIEKPASTASEFLFDTTATADKVISAGSSKISHIISDATNAAESIASSVLSAAKNKLDRASSVIVGTLPPHSESLISESSLCTSSISSGILEGIPSEEVTSSTKSFSSGASETLSIDEAASMVDSISSAASDAIPTDTATSTPKKVFGGAMAVKVEAKQIVLDTPFDDEQSYSDAIASMIEKAGEKAADLTKAISDAMLQPTPTQGAVESVTSLASEKYVKAMAAASSVLYGTTPGMFESLSSKMSDRYLQAVTAASYAIYGTPTPILQSLAAKATSQFSSAFDTFSAVASSELSKGLSLASAQYTSAKIAIGVEPSPVHQQYLAEAQRRYYEGIGIAHDQHSRFVAAISQAVYGTPTPAIQSFASAMSQSIFGTPAPAYETLLSVVQSRYNAAVSAASETLAAAMGHTTSEAGWLEAASRKYDDGVAAASSIYSAASESASIAVYGTQVPALEKLLSQAREQYSAAMAKASAQLASLTSSSRRPAQTFLDAANRQYFNAVETASSALAQAWSAASVEIYGTPTPTLEVWASVAKEWNDEVASRASENWALLVAKASSSIYDTPPPLTESVWHFAARATNAAGSYAASATEAANSQYSAISALISDLVVGKEPDFTESVMSRLSSAYHTGAPGIASSASSYASSVVNSIFTPPPTLEAILDSVSEQFNAAVAAASIQLYGIPKGPIEQVTEAAADAYGTAASRISVAVYGTETGYAEAAQQTLLEIAASAQSAISSALFGTPTATMEKMVSDAAGVYSSVSSMAAEGMSGVSEAVSGAIYGSEQGALESASSRVVAAVESARVAVSSMVNAVNEQREAKASEASRIIASAAKEASVSAGSLRDEL